MTPTQDLSARARITLQLDEARREKPANEAIIAACEVALRKLDEDLGARCALYIEMSQPREYEA